MEYLKIGIIGKAHGVKGAVRVFPLTDDIKRFRKLKKAFLMENSQYEQIEVTGVTFHDRTVFVKIQGIEDRNAAERLREQYLYVKREDAVQLPENSYFICDLLGAAVLDETGRKYGVVEDVYQTGANDVYLVRGEREWLMPAIRKLIQQVDTENKTIVVNSNVVREVVPDAD